MTIRVNTFIRKSNRRILRLALLSGLAVSALHAADSAAPGDSEHAGHGYRVPAKLVQTVRDA